MSDRQTAARKIMERFVVAHGGNCGDITVAGKAYHWTAHDGDTVAKIGWKS